MRPRIYVTIAPRREHMKTLEVVKKAARELSEEYGVKVDVVALYSSTPKPVVQVDDVVIPCDGVPRVDDIVEAVLALKVVRDEELVRKIIGAAAATALG